MIFKKGSRKKLMLVLLFMFALSAAAGVFLSAPVASAKTQQSNSSKSMSINLNGYQTATATPAGLSQQVAAAGQNGPKIVQSQNYNYKISTHEITTGVETSTSSTPLPLASPPATPQIVQTSSSITQSTTASGYDYYNVNYGNWTFIKSTPWDMQYINSTHVQTVALSSFEVLAGGTLYATHGAVVSLSVQSQMYTVNATLETSADLIGGYMWVQVNFASMPPTINAHFDKTGAFSSYNIIWVNTGVPYAKVNGAYYNIPAQAVTTVNSQTSLSLLSTQTAKSSTILNWVDFGNATVRMTSTLLDGKLYHVVYVMFTTNDPSVDPSVVQKTEGADTITLTGVTSGDLIVVGAGANFNSTGFEIQSQSGVSLSGEVSGNEHASPGCASYVVYCNAEIWAGSASSSTVSVTVWCDFAGIGYAGCSNSIWSPADFMYEVSGALTTAIGTASGTYGVGSPYCPSGCTETTSGSVSTTNYGFAVSILACDPNGYVGPTGGYGPSGYTGYLTGGGSCLEGSQSGYSTTGLSGTTNFPWNVQMNSLGGGVIVGVVFQIQTVTEHVTITPANSYSSSDTASISGCSPSVSTIAMDGSQHSFTALPSCSITYTVTISGTSGYSFASNATTWVYTTTSSGTDTKSNTVYRMYYNTLKVAANAQTDFDTSDSMAFTCSNSDTSGGTCSVTLTSATSDSKKFWTNYNQAITAPASSSTPPSNSRWENAAGTTSTAGTPTTGGNTYTVQYYKQWTETWTAAANARSTFDATMTAAVKGTYLGSAATTLCTITTTNGHATDSCSAYIDNSQAATFDTAMGSPPSNERWQCTSCVTASQTSGGIAVTINYYNQLSNTYAANAYSPSTFSASITFAVTGTLYGSSGQPVCTISVPGSPSSGSYNCTGYADYNTAVSLPAQSGNNPANTAWVQCQSGCTHMTFSFTDTTGGNSHTAGDYVKDFTNTYNANPTAPTTFSGSITFAVTGTIGGAASQPVCTITVPGSPSSVTYGCTGPSDSGTTVTVAATSGNNPASTRWQVSGTNTFSDSSGGNSHTANYYEQFQQTFRITANVQTNFDASMIFTITGTQLGTGGQTICTLTTAANATDTCSTGSTKSWADYNTQVSFPVNPTGAPSNSRWQASSQCTFTQTTAGNLDNCNYYKQWTNTFQYSVTYGGSPTAPTLTCNQYGSPVSTLTLTTSPQGFYCDNGAAATSTDPIAGAANERWSDDSGSFTISSGGGADTFAYYHQYDQTLSYSVVDGGSPTAPTATGTEFGSSYTPSLTTSPTKYWFDVTGSITFTNPTSGSSGSERWKTPTTSLSATSIGTAAPAYYHQYNYQFDYSITDGGAGYTAPTLTITYLGTGGNTTVLTTSLVHFWADATTSATSTNPLTGSNGNERWYTATASVTVSSSTTYTFAYYHQYLQTYSYTISGGAGSSSAPTFTFTYLGSAGTTDTASTTPATQFVDSTTSWTYTNPLTGSGSNERWAATSGTSGTISGAASIAPNYYHQFSYTLSYSVSGGGSPTVPTFSCLQFGSPFVYTLTGSGTAEWIDSGCSYSFANPAQLVNMPTSPTPKERWFTGITTSGSVSTYQTIAATYYNQYWLNNTALTLTYVYTDVTEPASVYQGWVDSGSSLTAAGAYSHIWAVKTQGSLYQTNNGIQYYGNHTLGSFTFTTVPLEVTFTATKVNATQWVSSNIAMTTTKVTDDGNSISFTTVAASDGTIYKFVGSSNFVVIYSSNGITSTTISNPIYQPEQTKTFAALSYFWTFYCDGVHIQMRTASDGITWSAPTQIAACVNGERFSVAISGTTIIYSRADESGNIYYRAGTISISAGAGVITWAAVEQTAVSGSTGTLGNNGALTNPISLSGTCYYASFSTSSPSGILSELHVGLSDSSASSYPISVGIYSSGGSLIASGTATVSVGTSAAYATIPFSSDAYLTSSTTYWLAVTSTASSLSLYDSSGSGGTSKYQNSCTSLPSSIGSTSSATTTVDIYGTWYQLQLPVVAVDTNGYSWISYSEWDGTHYYALVTETQNTNGVWAAAAGFPYQAATGTSSQYATEVTPITVGKVVLIWTQTGQKLNVQVWTGGTWSSTYQNTNPVQSLYYFSAQTSFDNVNIAFLWDNGGTYTVQIASFFYSPIGFIADTTLSTTATTSTSAPVIFKNSVTGNYDIFYVGSSNTVYAAPFSAAAAVGTPKLVFTDTNTITNNDQIDVVPLSDSTTRAGFMFLENASTPWKLQYLVIYFSAQFSLILDPDVGSHSVNSTNYFTVTYTLNGATQVLQYTGSPNSVLINADAGSNVTISGSSTLSNSNKEVWWFQTSGVAVTFTAGNSTISYTYYDLLAQVAQYAIVGGGSPTAPTLTYVTVPASASPTDSPLTTVYTLTTSPVTVYATRASTANATPQLNGITGEVWTPKVATWKISVYDQIPNPLNYYHQYQIGASYKLLFGGTFTAPKFTYVSDGATQKLNLTTTNQNVYVDVSSAWSVTSPLVGSTSTERAGTSPSSGTITTITAYVFTYTHQFGVQFKFTVLPTNGVTPSYSGVPTLTIIVGQAKTTVNLATTFTTEWVDAGTEWGALNPWVSGANSFNPTTVGGIIAAQGTISNTNPITIFYQLAPRCIGNNTTLLAEEGCFFPAVFYVFANLMGPFFAGLLIAGLCMAVYIKTENGILAVFLFFMSAIVLGYLFPPIFGQAILIGLAAMITFAIYESIRSSQ